MVSMLTIMAIGCGWTFWGGGAARFLGTGEYAGLHAHSWHPHGFFDIFTKAGEDPIPLIALVVALAGIGVAYLMYSARVITPERVGRLFAPVYTLFSRKYYMDELYENIFVVRMFVNGLCYILELFDTYVVDGIVNGFAKLSMVSGGAIRRVQTGQLQFYGLALIVGVVVVIAVWYAYI